MEAPRISRVTIARLHNLGNYEHVRYEVTVEIPPDSTPPAEVMRHLSEMLDSLEPKAPYSPAEVRQDMAIVSAPVPQIAHFMDGRNHYMSPQERLTEALRMREQAERRLARQKQWESSRDNALSRFNAFGGTSRHEDAKEKWDDDQS